MVGEIIVRIDMPTRIKLTDPDHPDEPIEVEVEASGETALRVHVVNTIVSFVMRRSDRKSPFTGTLGGRIFTFDMQPLSARKSA
jgi:hypothetical protein